MTAPTYTAQDRALHLLRLQPERWLWLDERQSWVFIGVPLGVWVVATWNRFGALFISDPRDALGFLLIGLDGWLFSALATWAGARWLSGNAELSPVKTVKLLGYAHLPLLVVGLGSALLPGLFGITGVVRPFAWIAAVIWMPAMLTVGVHAVSRLPIARSAAVVLPVHLVWLAIIGRWALSQIGHVL